MPQHQHQSGLQGGHHLGQRCGYVGWRRSPFGRAGAGCGRSSAATNTRGGGAVAWHAACCPAACPRHPQGVGGRNAFGHDEPAGAQPWRRLCRIRRGVQQLRCVQAQRRAAPGAPRPCMSGWRRRCGRGVRPGGRCRAGLGHRHCRWLGHGTVRLVGARWRARPPQRAAWRLGPGGQRFRRGSRRSRPSLCSMARWRASRFRLMVMGSQQGLAKWG